MSDLQVSLIILGAIIIAAVVVYNWLQERKLRKQVSSEFIVPQKDVLADDFYIDADAYVEKELAGVHTKDVNLETQPKELTDNLENIANSDVRNSLINSKESDVALAKNDLNTVENEINPLNSDANVSVGNTEQIVTATLHDHLKGMQTNLPDVTHQQIDLIAVLYATKNISADDLGTLKSSVADMGLPMVLHGLDTDDKWHLINETTPKASFKQVACSLQLADRGGPVAKNLLNKFQFAVEDAGLNLNAHVEWQGNGDALQRALELDQFCIEVDQLISVHLAQTDTPIHGTKFKGLAEASGLTLMTDGKFHYLHSGKQESLFVLIDTNNQPFTTDNLRSNVLKSVTFQIEIPKVSNCEQVFNQMIGVAQKMASSLNARMVDDNQKPLGDIQIEKIRQQLKVIHATMVARGIMPGSPASMRLFS